MTSSKVVSGPALYEVFRLVNNAQNTETDLWEELDDEEKQMWRAIAGMTNELAAATYAHRGLPRAE